MKFIGIKRKLISRISMILILSLTVVLLVVAYMSSTQAQLTAAQSAANSRSLLMAKGQLLAVNHQQVLAYWPGDGNFPAMAELLTNSINNDADMMYGRYLDADFNTLFEANSQQPSMSLNRDAEKQPDPLAQPPANPTELAIQTLWIAGVEVVDVVVPILQDDQLRGYLRYGLSTQSMQQQLTQTAEQAKRTLIQTMAILLGIAIIALWAGFSVARQLASGMTRPLQRLITASQTITGGDYKPIMDPMGQANDEISTLTEHFVIMGQAIDKKIQDLTRLNAVGQVLAALLDQNKALEEVLQAMHVHYGVAQGSVFLMNEDNQLEVRGFYPPKKVHAENIPVTFTMGEGVLGRAAKSKAIVFVADTSKDTNFVDAKGNTRPMALLCIPLLDKDMLIGVMNFSGKVEDVNFEQSDFAFASAIARMLVITIKNIRQREVIEAENRSLAQKVLTSSKALQAKTRDVANILHHTQQGILLIVQGGVIQDEYASCLTTLLQTDKIAHRHFMDLLFNRSDLSSEQLNQMATAIDGVFGQDVTMFERNRHLLVTELTLHWSADQHKIIALDWDPVIVDGVIDKVMVTVRDVSGIKEIQVQSQGLQRELTMISQILAIDESQFAMLIQSAQQWLTHSVQLIEATKIKDASVLETLSRHLHSVKGNVQRYGFSYVNESVAKAENSFTQLRDNAQQPWQPQALLTDLRQIEIDLSAYQQVARDKLNRSEDTGLCRLTTQHINRQQVANLLAEIGHIDVVNMSAAMQRILNSTYQMLLTMDAQLLSQVIEPVIHSVQSLAEQLNKPAPKVTIEGDPVYIKKATESMLNDVFMQVLCNAITHGIEAPEQRSALGKQAQGEIHIQVQRIAGGIELAVTDDGQGLAIRQLYQKALAEGIFAPEQCPSAAQIAKLIFVVGFTTGPDATDAVGGRGVGMDRVQTLLQQAGGQIEIELDNGDEDADYRHFITKIILPNTLCQIPLLASPAA